MSSWIHNMLVSVDQFANVALYAVKIGKHRLGSGFPDETLSAYWARIRNEARFADVASRGLERIDADHSFDAIERNPLTGLEEPHHLADYQILRLREEAALKAVLSTPDDIDLDERFDEETLRLAEMGAARMRLREEARDRAAGRIQ